MFYEYSIFIFYGTRGWTQGRRQAKQAFCSPSHIPRSTSGLDLAPGFWVRVCSCSTIICWKSAFSLLHCPCSFIKNKLIICMSVCFFGLFLANFVLVFSCSWGKVNSFSFFVMKKEVSQNNLWIYLIQVRLHKQVWFRIRFKVAKQKDSGVLGGTVRHRSDW